MSDLDNSEIDALLGDIEGIKGDEKEVKEEDAEEKLDELLGDIEGITEEIKEEQTENLDEEKVENPEGKEGTNEDTEENIEEDIHPFDPKELKLHEIDETMLVKRRAGQRNPHIEVVKNEDVEKYEYMDMSNEVIEKKFKTPKGKEEALIKKEGNDKRYNTNNNNNNKETQETVPQFDDSKLMQKIDKLASGLRIGIKQLKDNIDGVDLQVKQTQGNISQVENGVKNITDQKLSTLSSELNKIRVEINQKLSEVSQNNVNIQEEIKIQLKEVLNNQIKQQEETKKMFNDMKLFAIKLIEKVIEKEVDNNSKEIIENTLNNLSKEFDRITSVVLYLSPKDIELKEEMDNYIKELFSSVNNLEIKIDNNLTKGSFLFNTDNGNAQSILKDKINLIKDFL